MNDIDIKDELAEAWIFNEVLDGYDNRDIFEPIGVAPFLDWDDLIPAPTVKDVIALLTPTALMPIVEGDVDVSGE